MGLEGANKIKIMSKTTSYIVAILACAAYLLLYSAIVASNFKDAHIGTFWQILFLGVPIIGIWKGITSLGKKGKGQDIEADNTSNRIDQ